MELLSTKKACEILGIHPNTLRKWADEGKIKHIRTNAGQRRYDVASFLQSSSHRRQIVYARVSSRNQKDDLAGQVRELRERYPKHEVIEDFGSGLNFKRKGLQALLDAILSGTVEEVVVAHRDRLCRFGFELLESLANKHNCRIVVLNNTSLSPQAELVSDILAILHVFSSRLYGLRRYRRAIQEDKDLPQSIEPDTVEAISGADEVLVQQSG
jgi:putative resolvase